MGESPDPRAVESVPTGIRPDAYLPELESLRGIAIVLVYLFHADALLGYPVRNRYETWAPLPVALVWGGHTGVSLFFVLSAFLLSMPFLAEASGGSRVSRRTFYERRALRILPLFSVAVLVATVATFRSASGLWHALPYLTFTFHWPGLSKSVWPFSGAWWSLVAEVQFYVVLPLVALTFERSRATTVTLLGAFAVCWAAMVSSRRIPGALWPMLALGFLGRAPLFLCGILAAWFHRRHGKALRARLAHVIWLRAGGADVVLLGVVGALAAYLRWRLWAGSAPRSELLLLVPEGVAWALVLLGVLLLPLALRSLWTNAFLKWLGVLSYSIYLVHFPLLALSLGFARDLVPDAIGLYWTPASLTWLALATVACLAISSLTYRWIERPFLRLKSRGG